MDVLFLSFGVPTLVGFVVGWKFRALWLAVFSALVVGFVVFLVVSSGGSFAGVGNFATAFFAPIGAVFVGAMWVAWFFKGL